jgi:hypothetical protein
MIKNNSKNALYHSYPPKLSGKRHFYIIEKTCFSQVNMNAKFFVPSKSKYAVNNLPMEQRT